MSLLGRRGRRGELEATITRAIDQLAADEFYESERGYKLIDTVNQLRDVRRQAEELIATLGQLSPIGMAAMHDVGLRRGEDTGRHGLAEWRKDFAKIASIADSAADELIQMHSPLPDKGQGAGSAMGRDSDLRAIRADHGLRTSRLPPFRSPKDKFAVAIVKAIIRNGFDPAARGASAELTRRLNSIWRRFEGGRPPNWDRVVKARHAISELVDRELESEKVWKKVVQKRNATSRRTRRCILKESESYVVNPDHSGGSDAHSKSGGSGQPTRAKR